MFVELATNTPSFFEPYITEVTNAMFTIAGSEQLEDGLHSCLLSLKLVDTRRFAIEVLVSLSEGRAGLMRYSTTILLQPHRLRKLPNFVQNIIQLLLSWLINITDEADWYNFGDEPPISNHEIAQQALDRVAKGLGFP